MHTTALVQTLKSENQDFEFYPSTDEIISAIREDMYSRKYFEHKNYSFLDIGAGNGKTLNKITRKTDPKHAKSVTKYAIELSQILIEQQSSDIATIGTNFHNQTLFDKKVDIIYCNPPFSEFEIWVAKIIMEANCSVFYLTIPVRWKNSALIKQAQKERGLELEVIESFSFQNGERGARCDVDLLVCDTKKHCARNSGMQAYELWFNKHFNLEVTRNKSGELAEELLKSSREEREQRCLVEKKDIVTLLETYYDRDLNKILDTYKGIAAVDSDILGELNVDINSVQKALLQKINGLKNKYWKELLGSTKAITQRFTTKTRQSILDTFLERSNIDFTSANAYAVITWLIKNVNHYANDQINETVTKFFDSVNLQKYKSNDKVFCKAKWRCDELPYDLQRVKLNYRIVLDCLGVTIVNYTKLNTAAKAHIDDLCAIAIALGFDTMEQPRADDFEWEYGKANTLTFYCHRTQKVLPLFKAKFYKKGTAHLTLNHDFQAAINIALGKLKGWLNTAEEASHELDIPMNKAKALFSKNYHLELRDIELLSLTNNENAA